MRLIDKDNLRKPSKGMFIYQDEFEDDVQHVAFEAYTKDDIEREPTVQAIPIEWIKSKKIEYEHDRCDYVRGCFDGFNDCIDYLINEWEKENENRVE